MKCSAPLLTGHSPAVENRGVPVVWPPIPTSGFPNLLRCPTCLSLVGIVTAMTALTPFLAQNYSKSALRCSLLSVSGSTREVVPRANECRLKSVYSFAMEPSIHEGGGDDRNIFRPCCGQTFGRARGNESESSARLETLYSFILCLRNRALPESLLGAADLEILCSSATSGMALIPIP